ncbi:hypothetical protein ElyMa_005386500 [Elysia marginata]|uniref:Uncharacterized protein n=1 Tax=Elysia marginata TaxID=1093978 RepID=A0AAV4EEK6_9GAST|nr:hypothetical protein ElyMa_005386500 [Elysia marginata]
MTDRGIRQPRESLRLSDTRGDTFSLRVGGGNRPSWGLKAEWCLSGRAGAERARLACHIDYSLGSPRGPLEQQARLDICNGLGWMLCPRGKKSAFKTTGGLNPGQVPKTEHTSHHVPGSSLPQALVMRSDILGLQEAYLARVASAPVPLAPGEPPGSLDPLARQLPFCTQQALPSSPGTDKSSAQWVEKVDKWSVLVQDKHGFKWPLYNFPIKLKRTDLKEIEKRWEV